MTTLNFFADLAFAASLCWLTWQWLELLGEVIRWRVMRQHARKS